MSVFVGARGLGGEKPTLFTASFFLFFAVDAVGKALRLVMGTCYFSCYLLSLDLVPFLAQRAVFAVVARGREGGRPSLRTLFNGGGVKSEL